MSGAYTGPLKAAIFDWAGTIVDYGCIAPAQVFVETFAAEGVALTMAEARGPMGMHKRDHIRAVLALPEVAARWQSAHGAPPHEADIDRVYAAFVPRQIGLIGGSAEPIPGALEAVASLRARGLKIGGCTGYVRAMMNVLEPAARAKGYAPDVSVCSDEVGGGRPAPWMIFHIAQRLNVYPMAALVKIGDTEVDVAEGLNAGTWTVALAQTGNEIGLSEADLYALTAADREARLAAARAKLSAAGAHYVIDTLAGLLPVMDDIEARLTQGKRP
ncbi:MAG TPA: phosphonoacetaldehyde hydrolase [Candidatus Limnocylindrales bacterium]|nr:phosphonoacetaldehyde hydrolase [Candidatus Limnocylindrales bacterium]